MNDPRDLPLEDRLRAHFADQAAREPLPPAESAPSVREPTPAPWWRRPTLLAAAAGLLVLTGVATAVAVGGDDPEDLASVGGDTSTTSSVTAQPWQGTTSSTTSPTSSTTTVTADSVRGGVTVVVAPDGVLGWWDGSQWVRGDSGATPPITGGETYTLVQLGGRGTAVGSAPAAGCEFADPRPTQVDLGIAPSEDPLAPPPIGLLGVTDPHPRPVTQLGDRAEYVQIAQELAAARGLDADGAVIQAYRVDLGGNGTDEVLLSIERLSDRGTLLAGEGDYSLLVLRQVIDEQVQTTVLHESIGVSDPATGAPPFVVVGRVAAVADLNGDGRLEVVVQRTYYEGSSTHVWESDPAGGVHEILQVGCGV